MYFNNYCVKDACGNMHKIALHPKNQYKISDGRHILKNTLSIAALIGLTFCFGQTPAGAETQEYNGQNNPTIIQSGAYGGALFNASDETIDSLDAKFTENYISETNMSGYGGAFANLGTVNGGTITDIIGNYAEGYAYANGGAIFNTSANFTLDAINGEISNNHVSVAPNTGGGMGGAIYMDNGTINGGIVSQIKNNYVSGQRYAQYGANAGGAIVARSAATINFDEVGEISGNYVEAATGDADAGAIMAKGSIGVIKGDIKNNHVKSGSTYDANGNLTSGGRAYSGAMAISMDIGDIQGDITDNYAESRYYSLGGAIYNGYFGAASIKISGDVKNNYARDYGGSGSYGGAIYNNNGAAIEFNGSDLIGNYAKSGVQDAEGNLISNYGGGVAMGGALYNNSGATVTGTLGNITDNFAETFSNYAYGGAIYNTSANFTLDAINGEISNNYAKSYNAPARGGAIYMTSGTINGGAITAIVNNYAECASGTQSAGGAIFAYNSNSSGTQPTLNFDSIGEISGNYVKDKNRGDGGAIFAKQGTIGEITGDIKNNYIEAVSGYNSAGHATGGGGGKGGALASSLTINSIKGDVINNHVLGAYDAYGGAIYNGYFGGGSINFEGSDLKDNWVKALIYDADDNVVSGGGAAGGALYNYSNGSPSITGTLGEISGNWAESWGYNEAGGGGAIWNTSSNFNLTGITGDIINNHAKSYIPSSYGAPYGGGAIYNNGGNLGTISSSKISDNYAESAGLQANGGAIYNTGKMAFGTNGTDLLNNHASSLIKDADGNVTGGNVAYGGAIYNTGTVSGGVIGDIIGNYAEGYYLAQGGAIYNTSANFTLDAINGEISNNHVFSQKNTAQGGAIYMTAGTVKGGTVTDIIGNYAEGYGNAQGGAIYNTSANFTLDAINGNIKDNHAYAQQGTAQGGAIYMTAGTVKGGTVTDIIGNYAEGYYLAQGGAIYNTSANFTLDAINGEISNNHVFSQNNTAQGGAIYMTTGTVKGGTVTDIIGNYAEGYGMTQGGAIYNTSSNFTLDAINGEISNNHVFSQNTTAQGGAIYMTAGTVKGGTITDIIGNYTHGCMAYGGAIYNTSANFTLDAINGKISGNYAKINQYTGGGDGGAIYISAGTIKAINADVEDNYFEAYYSPSRGGAIYIGNAASVMFNGSDLKNNYITGNLNSGGAVAGGALYSDSGATVTGTLGEISGNYADMYNYNGQAYGGGAIWNSSANFNLTGITGDISNNHTKMYMNITSPPSGLTFGGGAIWNNNTDANFGTISSSKISDNYAESAGLPTYGGAIYNTGTMAFGTNGTDLLNNHASSLIKDANGNATGGNVAYGGAIYNTGTVSGGVIGDIIGNYTESWTFTYVSGGGGAIWNNSANFNLTGITGDISNNHTKMYMNITSGGPNFGGGAIYNSGGDLGTISSSKISDNYAESSGVPTYGGAIYNAGKMAFGTDGTDLLNNHTSSLIYNANGNITGGHSAQGGAIYNTGTVSGGVIGDIIGNYAEGYGNAQGGAIYNTSANFTLDAINGNIKDNHAYAQQGTAQGGAIYMTAGTVNGGFIGEISGNYVISKNANAEGGAIYNNSSNFKLDGITGDIKDNYVVSYTTNSVPVTGGAIYNAGGNLGVISSSQISDNFAAAATARVLGGAIFNSGTMAFGSEGTDLLNNHTISAKYDENGNMINGAEAHGGAIYNTGTVLGGVIGDIIGNYAEGYYPAQGGAIYNSSANFRLDEINGAISNNHVYGKNAYAYGGAIYNNGGNLGVLNATEITNNYAVGYSGAYGGAIYNTGTVTGGTIGDILNNYAEALEWGNAYGGAIYNTSANFRLDAINGNIVNNHVYSKQSNGMGGAIYNNSGYIGSINSEYVKDNYADSGAYNNFGGAIYNTGTIDSLVIENLENNNITGLSQNYGGAIYNTGTINSGAINLVKDNYISAKDNTLQGGAIYNKSTMNVDISNLINNHIYAEGNFNTDLRGGAIYNTGTIKSLNGDILNNYIYGQNCAPYIQGGAVYNTGTITGGTLGNISGNYVWDDGNSVSIPHGGAIYNTSANFKIDAINGDITNNYVHGGNGASGGAIYNEGGQFGDINGNIANNRADAKWEGSQTYGGFNAHGGAIYNSRGKIGNITGNITGNYAVDGSGFAQGGAIYNSSSTIGNISGNIVDNHVECAGAILGGQGGAIHNGSYSSIGNITGDIMSGNYTYTHEMNHYVDSGNDNGGGAIYNGTNSTIGDIVFGYISENYAKQEHYNYYGRSLGGAILNNGTIGNISATFDGNFTEALNAQSGIGGYARGGAIYNSGTIEAIINSNFVNNYTKGTNATARGGAIYTNKDLTILADTTYQHGNGVSIFRGNYTEDDNGIRQEAIYVGAADATLNLNAVNNSYIIFDDIINGETGYKILFDGDNSSNIFLNNQIQNANATLENTNLYIGITDKENNISDVLGHTNTEFNASSGTIHLEDNNTTNYNVNKLTSDNTNYIIDVDWDTDKADKLVLTDQTSAGTVNLYKLNVLNINKILDGKETAIAQVIKNADGDESNSPIQLTLDNLNTDNLKIPYTPHVYSDTKLVEVSNVTLETTDTLNDSIGLVGHQVNTLEYIANLEAKNDDKKVFEFTKETPAYKYTGNNLKIQGNLTFLGNSSDDNILDFSDKTKLETDENSKVFLNNVTVQNTKEFTNNGVLALNGANITNELTNNSEIVFLQTPSKLKTVNGENGKITYQAGIHEINYDSYNQEIINNNSALILNNNNYLNDRNNTLTMNNGSMTIQNLGLDVLTLNALNMNGGEVNILNVDVDLANKKMGRIVAENSKVPTGGTVNVKHLSLLSDSVNDSLSLDFAKGSFKDVVKSDVKEIYTPIYRYDVDYLKESGQFLFTRGAGASNDSSKYNPAVLTTSVGSQAGAQSTMNQTLYYSFEHGDTFMNNCSTDRFAMINSNTYALSTDYNENGEHINFDKANKGVWVKPYAVFENIPLKNGPKVNTISYGTLIGFDSDFHKLKNGWANVGTGYIGYSGSQIKYSGVDTTTNGGILGVTETFYKGNFWTAITATAGAGVAEAHTMYGKDDMTSLMAGIGSKTGYNFEFANGKFIIQPRIFLSYSMIKTFDYTNAAGVRINSDPLHTIQINPAIKFIGNIKDWQPYASVGMNWNVMNQTKVSANGVRLPEMHTKPYIEYGLGIQKHWNEKYSAYLQAMVRNGGRNGIALTGGFRIALGKEGKPIEKVQKNTVEKHSMSQKKTLKQLSATQKADFQKTTRTATKGFIR